VGGVSAVIGGGEVQSFSSAGIVSVSGNSSVNYDDSRSTLRYEWHCAEVSGAACKIVAGSDRASVLQLNYTRDSSFKILMLNVTLNVSNAAGSAWSVSSAKLRLLQSETSLPLISFVGGNVRYNAAQKIRLQAEVTGIGSGGNATIAWSSPTLQAMSIDLQSVALSPTRFRNVSGSQVVQLSLQPNALDYLSSYVFQLQVTVHGYAGLVVSQVTVALNRPPRPGSFSISPVSGNAFRTWFTFVASGWVDDAYDLPLSYVMAYRTLRLLAC